MHNNKTISARDLAYDSYSEYGEYVNQHRAIPSIGDGMIPVYRRVLLAADKYHEPTLSNSIISDTTRDYHGHGSASVEPVLSRLVRMKLLNGKGNHGIKLMHDHKHGAPRYTKASRNLAVNNVLMRLRDYSPSKINELNVLEPDYLITPVPIALVFGHFNIGIGANTNIPAFTYRSLVGAYRSNDWTKLRAQYGYDLGSGSEIKELWETGYGRVEYKMSTTYGWSEQDGCNVTIIEGSGELFRPNLSVFDEHCESGRVWIRDESKNSIRLVIGRSPRVRAITDEEITELCEQVATFTKTYDIKVAVRNTVERVSIYDWLTVTHQLYNEAHVKWQKDRVSETIHKIIVGSLIDPLRDSIIEGCDNDQLNQLAVEVYNNSIKSSLYEMGLDKIPECIPDELPDDVIDNLLSLPIRRLRNHDNDKAIEKNAKDYWEVYDFDSYAAIDEASNVIKL